MKKLRGIEFLPKEATYDEMNSPVGKLTIITTLKGLHAVLWEGDRKNPNCEKIINSFHQSKNEPTIVRTKRQLSEYFEGKRKVFDLPLVINGTDFQIQVWKQLLKIPYATTLTYAEQAEKVGDKNKARAVGLANGLNPI
jgi:methylated-DNA-[protein]-cysteine S-methyltransferase